MQEPALEKLNEDLAKAGFLLLGSFRPSPEDGVPDRSDGSPARDLLLVGSTGPSLWGRLTSAPEYQDGTPHPMDRYTKRALTHLAAGHGLEALFSFKGPPYFPFQQWALKCGGFSQSPLGVLAHETYGPWTGFRAAFLSAEPLAGLEQSMRTGPCETCLDKPCLTACPVNAITVETGYNVSACKSHLQKSPEFACWSGCLARHACPYGEDHKPHPQNALFHMKSFAGL
ncbi:MAG: hypothetical protein RDA78_08930 [Roseibium sp.]|uniref:hypothetical protein n=1 Tax=Roseibium sp. TaxID=1936156 RepID=UPI003D9C0CBE